MVSLFPPNYWEAVEEMGSASASGMQHTLMYDKLRNEASIKYLQGVFGFTFLRLMQLIFFSYYWQKYF